MTEEQVRALVLQIGNWLREKDREPHDLSDFECWHPRHHELAREFARDLLDAANVDDLGGCPLCCQ